MADRPAPRLLFLSSILLAACSSAPTAVDGGPDGSAPTRDAARGDGAADAKPVPSSDGAAPPVGRFAWCFPGTHPCSPGLKCLRAMCQPPCDPSKGEEKNPTCPEANDVCSKPSLGGLARCQRRCDLTKGASPNPDCPAGTRCLVPTGSKLAQCVSTTFPPVRGTVGLGAPCSDLFGEVCDGTKGLFCPTAKGTRICLKACDLTRGTQGHPDCAPGTECAPFFERPYVESTSFLGGACLPLATQGLNEPCAALDQRCKGGFLCVDGLCRLACDHDLARTNNPICKDLGPEYLCAFEGACLLGCDRKVGVVKGTTCPAGYYCDSDCQRLPPASPVGPKARDEACDDSAAAFRCQKGLACLESVCQPLCNPRDAAPACATGESCAERTDVPSGGICLAPASRRLGQLCNATSARCATGLSCANHRCYVTCDTAKGVLKNPDCPSPATQGCHTDVVTKPPICLDLCDPTTPVGTASTCPAGTACKTSTPEGGVCAPQVYYPGALTTPGAACDFFGTYAHKCDPEKGLGCGPNATCVAACDPQRGAATNPACKATETCAPSGFSLPGGVCHAAGTRQLGEWCSAANPCSATLVCASGQCAKPCDPRVGALQNPACPASATAYVCYRSWETALQAAVNLCRQVCDDAKGTYANPGCPVGTSCSRSSDLPAGTRAVCTPLSNPAPGALGFGALCTSSTLSPASMRCDSTKGLSCIGAYCTTACDPRKQNTDCAVGEVCLESYSSFLGGYCL